MNSNRTQKLVLHHNLLIVCFAVKFHLVIGSQEGKNLSISLWLKIIQHQLRGLKVNLQQCCRDYSIDFDPKKLHDALYDIEKIDVHGGSIRCYIKNSQKYLKTNRCKKILLDEISYLTINNFKKFNSQIYKDSKYFKNQLEKLKKEKKVIIGYGSPARVSTITNLSKINKDLINYIIDDSHLKQNRFTPGMHIKILPRKNNINRKINIVIVFAYEYFEDIKKYFKNQKVKFFKPIPFERLR